MRKQLASLQHAWSVASGVLGYGFQPEGDWAWQRKRSARSLGRVNPKRIIVVLYVDYVLMKEEAY